MKLFGNNSIKIIDYLKEPIINNELDITPENNLKHVYMSAT